MKESGQWSHKESWMCRRPKTAPTQNQGRDQFANRHQQQCGGLVSRQLYVIDAMEGRDVAKCNIPGAAFMQADFDEEVNIKFEGELVGLLPRKSISRSIHNMLWSRAAGESYAPY